MKPIVLCLLLLLSPLSYGQDQAPKCPAQLDITLRKLHSNESVNLCSYYQPHKPIVIVNTASHCGFTKQFSGLEALYQQYKDQGLVVLGFPSNSFNQEESSEEGTARVCFKNFGVTFPMFEHVEVKGASANPLFAYLAQKSQAPSWNFNKYLLMDEQVQHFGSSTKPLQSPLEDAIKLSL